MAGYPVEPSVTRLDLGGKALTNLLKEVLSYRAFNLMDETYVVNSIKERLCFVSTDFDRDLATCRLRGPTNTVRRDFVLPDYAGNFHGYVRGGPDDPRVRAREEQQRIKSSENGGGEAGEGGDAKRPRIANGGEAGAPEQAVAMNNERFTVMESLFRPADIGLPQGGVHECVMRSVGAVVGGGGRDLAPILLGNVLLVGGSARCPGLADRLRLELQSLAPTGVDVRVHVPHEPEKAALRGALRWAPSQECAAQRVTRAEYMERGHTLGHAKFFK